MSTLRLAAVICVVLMGRSGFARAQDAEAATALQAPPERAPEATAVEQVASARLNIPLPSRMLWNDLHVFQEREAELWSERYSHSVGLPATGIVIGMPLALMLIPWGGVLVADANRGYGYGDEDQRVRRTGALMLTSGLLVLGAVAVSIWQVGRVRRRRHAIDSELRALSASRTSIERMLELQQMSAPAPAP